MNLLAASRLPYYQFLLIVLILAVVACAAAYTWYKQGKQLKRINRQEISHDHTPGNGSIVFRVNYIYYWISVAKGTEYLPIQAEIKALTYDYPEDPDISKISNDLMLALNEKFLNVPAKS